MSLGMVVWLWYGEVHVRLRRTDGCRIESHCCAVGKVSEPRGAGSRRGVRGQGRTLDGRRTATNAGRNRRDGAAGADESRKRRAERNQRRAAGASSWRPPAPCPMIHLDTSALIASLTGPRSHAAVLRRLVSDGERLGVSALVLYEWRRGPRTQHELRDQEALVPGAGANAVG